MRKVPQLLGEPSAERMQHAALARYQDWLDAELGLSAGSYEESWQWSVDDLEAFWRTIVNFFDARFSEGRDVVLADGSMPGAR